MDTPEDRASDPARTYRAERFDRTSPVHVGMLSSQGNHVIIGSKGALHIPALKGKPVETGKSYEKSDLPALKQGIADKARKEDARQKLERETATKPVKNIQKPGAGLDRERADAARNARLKAIRESKNKN